MVAKAGKFAQGRPHLLSIANPCDDALDVGANAWVSVVSGLGAWVVCVGFKALTKP